MGGDGKKGGQRLGGGEGDKVPEELRLAYREDLGQKQTQAAESSSSSASASGNQGNQEVNTTTTPSLPQSPTQPAPPEATTDLRQRILNPPSPQQPQPHQQPHHIQQPIPPQVLVPAAPAATTTLDRVILFLLFLLGGLLWKKLGKVDVEILF